MTAEMTNREDFESERNEDRTQRGGPTSRVTTNETGGAAELVATLADPAAGRSASHALEAVHATSSPSAVTKKAAVTKTGFGIVRLLPTILVFVTLAGLGYLGHHHGWKVPKFSELFGREVKPEIAWCDEHGVPEAACIACNADLMPKGRLYGWCKIHGVHECVLEYPEIAQLRDPPIVTQADLDRAAHALAVRPRTKNNPACKMHLRRIQFLSRSVADKIGIDIRLVERGPIVESIRATGEIIYDPTRVARLSVRAAGTVWRVEKKLGDHVRQGDVLALVDAAEVGRAKGTLLDAMSQLDLQGKNYERLSTLDAVVAGRRVLEAETALASAEAAAQKAIQTLVNLGLPISFAAAKETPIAQLGETLHYLGLPDTIVQTLSSAEATSNLIPLRAPRAGVVVARDVVAGEVVDTTQMLFTVADTSHMWVTLDIPLEEVPYVAVGQKVVIHPDGANHAESGAVTWISTDVDNNTRTVTVRGDLPNQDGHLRSETFGTGEIVLREDTNAIIVPRDAVHWEGCCHIVFVRDKDFMKKGSYKVFHARSVRPGVTMGDVTEMIAGVLPGEVVVTKGGAALRAELLKGSLGAG